MFTSPKRAQYCNRGDGKLVPTLNAYEREDKLLSALSEKPTKGYCQTKELLEVNMQVRKCVEHMSVEVAECHRDALLAQRYTVTMVRAGNGNWIVRWR